MATATRPIAGGVRQAMIERATAARPAWKIVADFANGAQMHGFLAAGLYATADEAVAAYRRYRGLPQGADKVRAVEVKR